MAFGIKVIAEAEAVENSSEINRVSFNDLLVAQVQNTDDTEALLFRMLVSIEYLFRHCYFSYHAKSTPLFVYYGFRDKGYRGG